MDDDAFVAPVIFALSRSEMGGTQRTLALLLEGLDRTAFPPTVLLNEPGPIEAALQRLDVPYEIAAGSARSPNGVAHFLRTRRRTQARVLHLHASRALALAARALGLAVVERVNIIRTRGAGGFVDRPALDRALLRLAHRVIVPSHAMESQLLARGVPRDKVRLVPTGVSLPAPARPAAQVRAELGIDPCAIMVLCLGRLTHIKGQDVLVSAFAAVTREVPAAVLVLAGAGPDKSALEAMARTLGVDLRLPGDRPDVADLLSACDIYVQPSRSESFGLALHEAMLSGCAVIASDVDAIPEAVTPGETGILVRPGDAQALAQAIVALARDSTRRASLGSKARARVLGGQTVASMCRQTEAVYREALSCL